MGLQRTISITLSYLLLIGILYPLKGLLISLGIFVLFARNVHLAIIITEQRCDAWQCTVRTKQTRIRRSGTSLFHLYCSSWLTSLSHTMERSSFHHNEILLYNMSVFSLQSKNVSLLYRKEKKSTFIFE